MISEFFINLGATVVAWFFSLLPTWDAPGWFTSFPTTWNGFVSNAGGLSPWIPWALTFAVFGIVIAVYVGMFIVKIVMKAAAFIPLFGGSG